MMQMRYLDILSRMRAASALGERNREVTLIAASKGQSAEAIRELYDLGQRNFGENYAQELETKAAQFERWGISDIRWHMIGHVQTNKIKSLIPRIRCLHTIDSLRVLHEVSKRWLASEKKTPLEAFIEVNIDEEKSKSGVLPHEVVDLAREFKNHPHLFLQGLMCIPNPDGDAAQSFAKLRSLEEECRPWSHGGLSMGMSTDFETAIREGATHIRVGTSLFGKRLVNIH